LVLRAGFIASGFAASLVLMLGAGMVGRARAFSEPRTYAADPKGGGGGNRWFTGSPAEGYGCSDCHSGGQAPRMQITGLPTTGYLPGGVYDVHVAWPEFAAHFQQLKDQAAVPPPPGVAPPNPPSMGLLAELVADNGLGAGTIDIADSSDAPPTERCAGGRFGTELFKVRPGFKTMKMVNSCQAAALGERCILAIRACGPQELHFRWTAPPLPQGAIWFAAGMVGTDAFSGGPQGDGVTETTRVMLPVGTGGTTYESVLRGTGCSAAGSRRGDRGTAPIAWMSIALFVLGWGVRVRSARRTQRRVGP
jgi:hypothetical protein